MTVRSFRRALRAFALLSLAAGMAAPAGAVETGAIAPAMSLPGVKAPLSLSDFKGKVVYLDFWASWCGPCKKSFPWMNQMQEKYGARGFQVLAVNLDANEDDARQFLAKVPAHFAVAFDARGLSARQYGVKGMPTSVLIGADGKVLATHTGFTDAGREALEQALVAALAVRP